MRMTKPTHGTLAHSLHLIEELTESYNEKAVFHLDSDTFNISVYEWDVVSSNYDNDLLNNRLRDADFLERHCHSFRQLMIT